MRTARKSWSKESKARRALNGDRQRPSSVSRRAFLGKASGATAALAAASAALPASIVAQSSAGGGPRPRPFADASSVSAKSGPRSDNYVNAHSRQGAVFALRMEEATSDFLAGVPPQTPNTDSSYPDKGGVFTKCLVHDNYGRVDLVKSYPSYTNALTTGTQSAFESIILGSGGRTLNGPQGGLRYQIEGLDTAQFASPAAPALSSKEFAAEMIEMYWASLLRDVEFNDYANNATAVAAAAELNANAYYNGPRNPGTGEVDTSVLFRGGFGRTPNYYPEGSSSYFPGELTGPYLSQFLVLPAFLGAQPISQQWQVFLPANGGGADYMTDAPASGFAGSNWLNVQNGAQLTALPQLQFDPTYRYLRNGRDMASMTHSDLPPQEVIIALSILLSYAGSNPHVGTGSEVINPGSPYYTMIADNGFNTFGGPDISSLVGQVAARALDVVWYQKWQVHLRIRPEVVGAFAHLALTGQGAYTDVVLDSSLLNSQGMANSRAQCGTYLLSQAFPEGAPSHPDYPTGHGTWIGASITILKFFFNGNFVIPNPMEVEAGSDGLTLVPYTGASLTVNGELNKLAHNVSFGHGIHSGIHFRSATDQSILLGEAFALSVLQDVVQAYNERVTITIQRFNGTNYTITNNGGAPTEIG